ncbi:MAG TPA: heavy metal-binding domain-containing protein [Cyclobacteriaceae bacterium]
MNALKKICIAVIVITTTINFSMAQNYKAPKIDASGKITDKEGKHVGNVSMEGIITDVAGAEIAHVDAAGMLIDTKTGKKLGKAEKNGNFVPYLPTPEEGWTVGPPMNGVCLVKDKEGNVIAEVHESYKQFGACAIHCSSHKMDHNKVLDENAAAYSCPMHPDVTSAKAGKCSKCGMALVKNKK